jgi:predicted regulator of Ras-like GTPase activity (Roadblock/LC7/MglB family)
MPFKAILNRILDAVPEAKGAILVDFEGECVQYVSKMDDHELKVIGAYQVIHFGAFKETETTTETFITKSDSMDIVSVRIDEDYFICLVLNKGSVLGRVEFVLRSKLEELKSLM